MCQSDYKYFLVEMRNKDGEQCNKAVMRGQSFTAAMVMEQYQLACQKVTNVLEIGYDAFVRIEEANK